MKKTLMIPALVTILAACGGGSGEAAPAPASPSASAEPETVDDQIAAGQKLYADNCAGCHGAGGEGSAKSPRVVGVAQGALPLDPPPNAKFRKVQFKTAADVGGWVAKNMPPGGGGSLKEWQYWAILAFDLKANGVTPPKKVDAASAQTIVLHP